MYESLTLPEGHRLEVLKNMLLCVLETKTRETSGSYKNLQQEEADWVLRLLLLADHMTQNYMEGAIRSDGTDQELTQNCT